MFGLLERVLWPVRAADRMRARLADVLRSLAGSALACAKPGGLRRAEVDAQRRLISQQVADVQGFIESSKFELDGGRHECHAAATGDAQTVFLLFSGDRPARGWAPANGAGGNAARAEEASAALEALAEHLQRGGDMLAIDADDTLATAERDFTADQGMHVLYREFVVAVSRLVGDGRRASRV